MKKVLYRLQSYYTNEATDVEKPVIRYILDHSREVSEMDIHKLSKFGYCSPATIVRICKKNGFKGFKDMKLALISDIHLTDDLLRESICYTSSIDRKKMIEEVFQENITALKNTYNLVDPQTIEKVVQLIRHAKLIRLFGVGASFLVAKDLQQKLERINKASILYEDMHMQIINSGNATKDDLAIIISYSGQTKEIIEMAKNIKQNDAVLISLTQYSNNKLMTMSDYNLFVPVIEKPLRLSAGSSRVSQLTVVDYIYHSYLGSMKENYLDKIINTNKMLEKEE